METKTKYKISLIGYALDTSACPPAIVYSVFPNFNGEKVELNQQFCTVEFDKPQTPVDLGPLVKIELLQELDA